MTHNPDRCPEPKMDKEDFSRYSLAQLRVEWNKERIQIALAQERQEAICCEVLRRADTLETIR